MECKQNQSTFCNTNYKLQNSHNIPPIANLTDWETLTIKLLIQKDKKNTQHTDCSTNKYKHWDANTIAHAMPTVRASINPKQDEHCNPGFYYFGQGLAHFDLKTFIVVLQT